MKKKVLAAVACALFFAAIPSTTSFAGQWRQDNVGFWYENDNGSFVTNTWLQEGGQWYHFNSNGYMQKSEWIMDSGKWYYLDANGICLTNTTTPDNYLVDANGVYVFQMPAAGLPAIQSLHFISNDEKVAYYSQSTDEMIYNSTMSFISDLSIPDDMNEIVVDPEYYAAVCNHALKQYQDVDLAGFMVSTNPVTRIFGYALDEYRQVDIKYLSAMIKNLNNHDYAAYVKNLKNVEKDYAVIEQKYSPYIDEFSNAYYEDYYSDYYSDYYDDYYSDY